VLVGKVDAINDPLKSGNEPSQLSRLLSAKNDEIFKEVVEDRFKRLQQLMATLIAQVPNAKPDVTDLQKEINRLLASEKAHTQRYEELRAKTQEDSTKLEDFLYKWGMAKHALDKQKSQTAQYMEMLNRQSAPAQSPEAPKQPNGQAPNGVREVSNGAANEEVESAKRAALAEAQKRKEQVAELEAENAKLNEQLTSAVTRANSLTDEDYSRTELFKALKTQHEDVIKRINDLEATNIQLREEAKKLQAERMSHRTLVDDECRAKCDEAEAQVARVEQDVQRIRAERDIIHQQRTILESNKTSYDLAVREIKELNEANEKQISSLEDEIKLLKLKLGEVQPEASIDDLVGKGEEALKAELISVRSQFSQISSQTAGMEVAMKRFKDKAQQKVKETVDLEEKIKNLQKIKVNLESKRFSERQLLEQRKMECDNMRKQSGKSAEIIQQLKDAENKTRELCANLEKQVAEHRLQVEILTTQNRALTQQVDNLNTIAAGHTTQLESWKKTIASKDTELAAALKAQHDAEADLAGAKLRASDMKKKVDEWKNRSASNPNEELQMLRTFAFCQICKNNPKDTLLKTCGHILCKECADSRIKNRQRKCPSCMRPFGQADLMTVLLV
jgi:E3 ubiquitin-protein ligase BRE1